LRDGERSGAAVLKHLDPAPRVREGLMLAEAGLPTAMIDISDGLLADLGHILDQSGKGATIELAKLPLSPAFAAHIRGSQTDPFLMPLAGGEDYELLFTVPPDKYTAVMATLTPLATQVTLLGEITTAGLKVIGAGGEEYPVPASGYNHFLPAIDFSNPI